MSNPEEEPSWESLGEVLSSNRSIEDKVSYYERLRELPEARKQEALRRANIAEAERVFDFGPVTPIERYRAFQGDPDQLFQLCQECSRLPVIHKRIFDTFKPRKRWPSVQEALDVSRLFSRGEAKPILVLAGPAGTGKSHLLQSIGWTLVDNGRLCCYITQVDLLGEIRSHLRSPDYDDVLSHFMNVPYLLLDDLGTAGATDWSMGILDNLIDFRWQNRMSMVIATNAKAVELQQRIADRLNDKEVSTVVAISAPSFRSGEKW